MSISMYELTVPQFNRVLKSLKIIMTKAEEHATAKKLDPAALLTARLYPDMFHMTRQVASATSMIQWGCALLAGQERPDFGPLEPNFADIQARIQKTVEFVAGYKPEQLNGTENNPVQLKFPNFTMDFVGTSFVFEFVFPNMYFHATTAYDILRHNGVELGKRDFLARG